MPGRCTLLDPLINPLNLQVGNRFCDSPHPVLLLTSSSMDPLISFLLHESQLGINPCGQHAGLIPYDLQVGAASTEVVAPIVIGRIKIAACRPAQPGLL